MTRGRAALVSVEWALYDSTPGREQPRLLGYSTGRLGEQNFIDAISRIQLGTTPAPAQVVVSTLKGENREDGRYLALAIHEYAPGGKAGQPGQRAEQTRYFCVSYGRLAAAGIGYQAMYQALHATPLRRHAGPPLPVSVEAPGLLIPEITPLAAEVAALLLTGSPVCVLGADAVSVPDRLAFIDTVMALLPYGLRSTMTAATWIHPVKDLSFKLFFTSERRTRHPGDHVVTWGAKASRAAIPAEPGYARGYYDWLTETVGRLTTGLSGITSPVGFGRRDLVARALRQAGVPSDKLGPDLAEADDEKDPTEAILLECVDELGARDETALLDKLVALRVYAEHTKARPEDQNHYQRILTKYELLHPGLAAGRVEPEFYYALLRLAFGVPLTYEAYGRLEECLAAQSAPADPQAAIPRLHPALLAAVNRALRTDQDNGNADARVAAVVAAALSEAERDGWSFAGLLDPARLIELLAEPWDRPRHAALVLDVTVNRLTAAMRDRTSATAKRALTALGNHGYLAPALKQRHPKALQTQISGLDALFDAVHPELLSWPAIEAVIGHGSLTPALRAVLTRRTADPESLARLTEWPAL